MVKVRALVAMAIALASGLAIANTVEMFGPLEMYELVLRDPEVIKYLHVDVPGRLPVAVCRVLSHPDVARLDLPYPIRLVEPNTADVSEALCFTEVRWDDKEGMLKISYPPEGITGRFMFTQAAGNWKVKSRRIREH